MQVPDKIRARYLAVCALRDHPTTGAPEREAAARQARHLEERYPGLRERPARKQSAPTESKQSLYEQIKNAALAGLDGSVLGAAVHRIAQQAVRISIVPHADGGYYVGIDISAEAVQAADRLNARDVLFATIGGMVTSKLSGSK